MSLLPARLAMLGATAVAFLFTVPGQSHAQAQPHGAVVGGPPPVIRKSTQLVAVPISVKNSHGAFVQGLTEADFRIWQDGIPQTITFFRQQNTPVTAGLVVDRSGSMYPKLASVDAAVYDFAHSSNRDDQIFVVDFNQQVRFELLSGGGQFTSNPLILQQAVSRVPASGETALYDAVAAALVQLDQGDRPMKALIIISDGGDNVSHRDFSQVLHLARRSHAVIYAIGLTGASGEEEDPGVLKRLCRATGGMVLFPGSMEQIRADSRKIAQDIRSRYMIGYVPPEQSFRRSYHKIRVRVAASGFGKLLVRARPGFFAGRETAQGPSDSSAVLTH